MRLATIALLAVTPATVAAQNVDSTDPTVDLQLFHPSPGANNFFTTESGDVNSHLDVSLGLNLDYARNPLTVQILQADGAQEPVGAIVGHRVDAVLLAAIGLFEIGEIGFALPMILQGGRDEAAFGGANIQLGEALSSFAVGDLRIVPKVRFLSLGRGAFSAAVVGTVILPTAGRKPYASENGVVVAPSLALSTRTGSMRAGVNLGYRLRDKTQIDPSSADTPAQVLLTVDDEYFVKAAVAFDVTLGSSRPFELVGELFGHTPVNNPFAINAKNDTATKRQMVRTSLEGDLGIRWVILQQLVITGGVGLGLLPQGYGQPIPRVFAGLTWYSGAFGIADADGDGVPDDADRCPERKEDIDNWQDSDGCPDLDNDEDNVLDEDDQCPMEPEDRDGLGDEDGCPESDFDEDGVSDEEDQCQGDVEDQDGFEDEDGCVDLDNDGDNIADKVDQCPMEPEDVDGFEDVNGCPDPDNDNDGLPDLGDLCPNHAEDIDNVADDDGCPEDNDGDGIPDDVDKCPNKAEIYNGVEDEDGCPEKLRAKSLVKVTEEKIEIKEKVFFKTGSAEIMDKSHKLLDQVAAVLRNYKHIRKVRIEGHTDSRGRRRRNLTLSQERAEAVRQYLVANGIEEARLEAVGMGPDKPIASNRSRRGREQNRRVEFVIAELKPIGVDVSEGKEPAEIEMKFEGLGGESGEIELEMDFGDLPAETPEDKPDGEEEEPEIEFDF
jgi:outer membrane protein OmpA-like peptidoglycan-associated protein